MKNIAIILLLFLLLISCSNLNEKDKSEEYVSKNTYKVVEQKIEKKDTFYKLLIKYPKLVVSGNKKNNITDVFNTKVLSIINKKYSEYKGEALLQIKKEVESYTSNAIYELNISYKVYRNNNIISILLTTYEYSLGAHGRSLLNSINFDSKSNKFITLEELFYLDKNKHLDKLNKLLTENITDNETLFEPDIIINNKFSTFNITNEDIIFSFEPYEIAPYAAGIIDIKLSLSYLIDEGYLRYDNLFHK